MTEEKREQLNQLNRELMVTNADYEELKKRLEEFGEKIFIYKTEIENLLNGE